MSESEGANASSANANAQGGEADHEEPRENVTDVNARLLRESKEWKAKYQQLKHEREESEKRRLETNQEYKALAEKLTNEKKILEEAFKRERIRAAVHDRALRAGCVNVEDLLQVGNKDLLQVDEETHQVSGADLFVDEAKRLKPYLFQSKPAGKTSTINSVTPGSVPEKKISSAEVAAMKDTDPRKRDAWISAFKAKQA